MLWDKVIQLSVAKSDFYAFNAYCIQPFYDNSKDITHRHWPKTQCIPVP